VIVLRRELNRSQLKMSGKQLRIRRRQLEAIYGSICWICGRDIPTGERSIDHVIPLTRGGTHALGNLRFAHQRCNQDRGNPELPACKGVVRVAT
jgi:5-methylcytosine-specific restriction endonuclease McrA